MIHSCVVDVVVVSICGNNDRDADKNGDGDGRLVVWGDGGNKIDLLVTLRLMT